jgi:hypothetical protein
VLYNNNKLNLLCFNIALVYFSNEENITGSIDLEAYIRYILIKAVQENKTAVIFYNNTTRVKFQINNNVIYKATHSVKPASNITISDFKHYMIVNLSLI